MIFSLDANVFPVQVFASDADAGVNAEISYSILSGNTGAIFSINASSGALYVEKGEELDYGKQSYYTLGIQAQDGEYKYSPVRSDGGGGGGLEVVVVVLSLSSLLSLLLLLL